MWTLISSALADQQVFKKAKHLLLLLSPAPTRSDLSVGLGLS
jgi:hypothetical protein